MDKFKEIKSILNNKEVVEKYLGLPEKHNSTGSWYKSPFRSERTASFCVSDRGIHDFGDSEHYDIISFVAKYFKTTQNQAVNILCSDFNIKIGNEYEDKEILAILKKQREEERLIRETIQNWFYSTFQRLCDENNMNKRIIKLLQGKGYSGILNILYMKDIKLETILERFINADESEKEKLYIGREEIESELC